MLTIGQTPRDDILPEFKEILGDEFEIMEAGALDGLALEDVKAIDVRPDDYILVSRMRDGTEVKITKRFIVTKAAGAPFVLVRYILWLCQIPDSLTVLLA